MYCQKTTATAIAIKYQIGLTYSPKVFPKIFNLKIVNTTKVSITARKIGMNMKSFLTSQAGFCGKISKLLLPGSYTPDCIKGWLNRDPPLFWQSIFCSPT